MEKYHNVDKLKISIIIANKIRNFAEKLINLNINLFY